jgi:DNA phosphorothioation-associated putative methyltransferase
MRRASPAIPDDRSERSGPILRHRTAIRRGAHSRPVSLALTHGLVGPDISFFDYGCGLGEDVRLLKAGGIRAEGWDPYYLPGTRVEAADCVNLGYVLNVIENQEERERTLRFAYVLARRVLVVSVRVDQSLSSGTDFSDGLVTNSGSFQKIYTQNEFREYIQTVLGRKPYMCGLGIAYVFKDEAAESAHLAQLSITPVRRERADLFAQFAADLEGQALLELTRTLGRLPLPSEFENYPALQLRFGSRARIERLVAGLLNPQSLAETKEAKRNDILTYIAMLHLRGVRPPRIRLLPPETQADLKLLWPSYKSAVEEGRQFLFSLAKPDRIREACLSAPVGKRLPSDFYLHRSAEDSLPALLRVLLFAARQVVGEVDYNIVKIAMVGRKVSFLNYKDFDENAHPDLLHSVRVHLPTASYMVRDYSLSENPPILHRKEAFVDALYPEYTTFAEFTKQEEELGLLSQPDIGFRRQWQGFLAERQLRIVGHSVVKATEGEEDGGVPPEPS